MTKDDGGRGDFETSASEADDDAPTQRISGSTASHTSPTRAGVIGPRLAASIRADYEATVADEDQITFVGKIDEDGRIIVPASLRASRSLKPGDEILVRLQKIK